MRLLYLHGSGASGEIGKAQTGTTLSASIRALLPATWEFDFFDAPLACVGAEELSVIYPGPYYNFFERYTEENMQYAVDYVRKVVEEDRPYDAVMGFSQGASVAAAYLAQCEQDTSIEPPFRFAIFNCAALIPPKIAFGSDLVKTIGSFGYIDTHSLHIIGQKDLSYLQSVQLTKTCNSTNACVLFHNSGHDIPRDIKTTKEIVSSIEKTARVAFLGQ